jgi:hypothetical protein
MYIVTDVKQIDIQQAHLSVLDPSPFEFETAVAKLKRHKGKGHDQIWAELVQAGGETLRSEIHKHINCI